MTPSEAIARRYADIFVQLFDSVDADWQKPWITPGFFPQQGLDGRVFEGSNQLLASLFASQKHYGIPVWMTFNMAKDLGLTVNKGARSLPVTHFSHYYVDAQTHERTSLTDEQYKALTVDEQKKYQRWTNVSWYSEFNIDQTNFSEVYPKQYEELVAHFNAQEKRPFTEQDIDRMIDNQEWICRIEVKGTDEPAYDPLNYCIHMPEKSYFPDESRFYASLFREMSHSLGDEMFRDRNLYFEGLAEFAQENMIAELSAATLCSMIGIDATMSDNSLVYLKSWANAIDKNPNIIYSVVKEAAGTAKDISERLGFERRPGFNLSEVMSRIEKAEQKRGEKKEAAAVQGHRQGWNPVKYGDKGVKHKM